MDGRTASTAQVACLALVLLTASVASPVVAADAGGDPDPREAVGQDVETDEIRIVVSVGENGTARWELQYWTRLDDENTTRAFESLRQDIEANPGNYTADFRDRIEGTVEAAENDTGRGMAARNVSVSADRRSIPDEYGVVAYAFAWEGFAAVDGEEIRVGDAIRGFFLSSETRMTVEWPAGYDADASPEPDDSGDASITWRGSITDFASDEPSIVLTPAENGGGDGDAGAGGDGAGDGDAGGGDGAARLLAALVLVGVAAAAAGAYWLRDGEDNPSAGDASDENSAAGGDTAADDAGAGDAAAASAAGSATESTDDGPPPELLSNEERVLRLLDQRGGRVKQQEVVETLDWTEAKTSQVVSDLRDEGKLESFRLGRENVLSLPGEGPDEAEP